MKKIIKRQLWIALVNALCLIAIILFAASCYKQETHYTVNFTGEEIDINSQSIVRGGYVTAPENPKRENYDFGGWFIDNGTFINEWIFETDIITQDTTLYAKWEENIVIDYPVEISFTELVVGSSCHWESFEHSKVIIINSEEALSNYIVCENNDYSNIDFSKHSLLLARSNAFSTILYMNIKFLQEEANKYVLNVNIYRGPLQYPEPWLIAIITPKIDNKATIALNVQQLLY